MGHIKAEKNNKMCDKIILRGAKTNGLNGVDHSHFLLV